MAVIATGFFDGVHLGHRRVIDALLSEAEKRGEQSVVITFWPHPRVVLGLDADRLELITSQEEKLSIIRGLGVQAVDVIPFSREFASMTAEQYIRNVILTHYDCSCLVLGYDTRLGSDRLGPQEIAAVASGMGLDSVIVPPVLYKGREISSTRIRAALDGGDTVSASEMLGRSE